MEEIQTTLSHIPDNDGNVKILKDVITNLMRVVDKQAQQISLLEAEHANIKQQVANNANSIYEIVYVTSKGIQENSVSYSMLSTLASTRSMKYSVYSPRYCKYR